MSTKGTAEPCPPMGFESANMKMNMKEHVKTMNSAWGYRTRSIRALAQLVSVCGLSLVSALFFGGCSFGPPPSNMVVTQVAPSAEPTELVKAPGSVVVAGDTSINSYEECVAAGNMTTRSLPPRCITKDGRSFVRGQQSPDRAEFDGGGFHESDSIRLIPAEGGEGPSARSAISSFDECVAAGFEIRRTLPPSCADDRGRVFSEGIAGVAEYEDAASAKETDGDSKSEGTVTKQKRFCKDLCGDGVCQEIVCMALGCPCAENNANCPADCPGA